MTKAQPWEAAMASLHNLTDAEYFADYANWMTAHNLQSFRHSPMGYHRSQLGLVERHQSPAFAFGTAAHIHILEGADAFHAAYSVCDGPINPKTDKPFGQASKRYTEWIEELTKAGKSPIKESDYYKIKCMANHIESHAEASKLLGTEYGRPELTIRGTLQGIKSQSKIDWLDSANNMIVDLKTCADLGSAHTTHYPCKFARDANIFGYPQQLAFYRSMVAALTGEIYKVYIVAVEKTEPFEVGVFEMSAATLDAAEEQNRHTMHEYKQCLADDLWPSRFADIITL